MDTYLYACVFLFVCLFNLTCVHPKVILHAYVVDCECMCNCVRVSVVDSVSVYAFICMSEYEKNVVFGRFCVYVVQIYV